MKQQWYLIAGESPSATSYSLFPLHGMVFPFLPEKEVGCLLPDSHSRWSKKTLPTPSALLCWRGQTKWLKQICEAVSTYPPLPTITSKSKFKYGPKGCGGWCTACILSLQRIMPCFCTAIDFPTEESHPSDVLIWNTFLSLQWSILTIGYVLLSFQNLLTKTPLPWMGKRVTWSLF